jgi:hypothetical protein
VYQDCRDNRCIYYLYCCCLWGIVEGPLKDKVGRRIGVHWIRKVPQFQNSSMRVHSYRKLPLEFFIMHAYSGLRQFHRLRRGRLIIGKKSISAGNGFDGELYSTYVQAVSNRLGRVYKSWTEEQSFCTHKYTLPQNRIVLTDRFNHKFYIIQLSSFNNICEILTCTSMYNKPTNVKIKILVRQNMIKNI